MELVTETPDLLTRMLRNRTMRNMIAIALFAYTTDVYFNAGKAFVKGLIDGWNHAPFLQLPK